ncbi:MAG: cyclic nucleotide-binding domain-containing protein [Thermoanaerobaculia bacterium]
MDLWNSTRCQDFLFRTFDLRPGEGRPTLFLLAQSLCNGIFIAFFFSFANASFLSHYSARWLPSAYIASGVVGSLAVWLFSLFQRRVPFRRLLTGNLIFLLAAVCAFRLGFGLGDPRWMSLLVFVCVDPLLTLLDLGFWGLAGRTYDLQQGKRLFGLVSSGEVVAEILGFFLVPVLVSFFSRDAADLLLLAAVGLALCLLVVLAGARGLPAEAEAGKVLPAPVERPAAPPGGLLRDRYFVRVSLLAVCLIFTLYFVDFGFLSSTRATFHNKEALAIFLGVFWGATKVVELAMKTFLSGRLIQQFGLLFGLLSLPAGVLLCALLAAGSAGLQGTAALSFFVFLCLAKLMEFVVRRSLFDPSFKVLFQPVDENERFAFQTRVEGTVKQASLGLAGLALLLIGRSPALGPASVVWLLVFLLMAWLALTLLTHREYHARLMQLLSRRTRPPDIDSPFEQMLRGLHTAPPVEAIYTLNVLERSDPTLHEETLCDLLGSDNPELRREAAGRIGRLRLLDRLRELRGREAAELQLDVRAVLRETVCTLEALLAGATFERVRALALSEETEERRLAASLLASLDGDEAAELLPRLLWDNSPAVRRAALRAAASSFGRPLWPRVVEQLRASECCREAAAALVAIGAPVLKALEEMFRHSEQSPRTLLRILQIYEQVPGPESERLLLDKLTYPHREVRQQALLILAKRGFRADSLQDDMVKQQIENVAGHMAWITAAQIDLGTDPAVAEVAAALERDREQDWESIFLLLSLLADPLAVDLMRQSLADPTGQGRAYLFEIAEAVVPPDVRTALFPLFEHLAPSQLLERLQRSFPQSQLGRVGRLCEIIHQGSSHRDHWSRACAIRALVDLPAPVVPDELLASLHHPEPLIRELAAWAVHQLDGELFARRRGSLPPQEARALERRLRREEELPPLLLFERAEILRGSPIFSLVPPAELVRLSTAIAEVRLQPGGVLFQAGDPGDAIYITVAGRVELEKRGRVVDWIEAGELLGEMAAVETGVRSATARAVEPSRLLAIEQATLHELITDCLEILPGIIQVIAQRRREPADAAPPAAPSELALSLSGGEISYIGRSSFP